jgi:hypothetical protein
MIDVADFLNSWLLIKILQVVPEIGTGLLVSDE